MAWAVFFVEPAQPVYPLPDLKSVTWRNHGGEIYRLIRRDLTRERVAASKKEFRCRW